MKIAMEWYWYNLIMLERFLAAKKISENIFAVKINLATFTHMFLSVLNQVILKRMDQRCWLLDIILLRLHHNLLMRTRMVDPVQEWYRVTVQLHPALDLQG